MFLVPIYVSGFYFAFSIWQFHHYTINLPPLTSKTDFV